jgi:aminoglycoside/choline kinase family phosphotransferase
VLETEEYVLSPASADASFRRYFRIAVDGGTRIVMDAPPDKEDSRPFVTIAKLLQAAGLHGPQVLASDLEKGFLLLTDLGTRLYIDALQQGDPEPLMQDAIRALVQWQCASQPGVLPAYDRALLQRELDLFPDWYITRHLQRELSTVQRAAWDAVCEQLIAAALAQPQVYVHRDYMPRNLMVSEPNPGIIDFQDAVFGPIAYDLLSLFKDAFLSWPAEQVAVWRQQYHAAASAAGLPVGSADDFERAFDWIGLQRHLKVLGIFARICYRDGKPHYLSDTPRFIGYIREVLPGYPELEPLLALFDELGMEA